MTTPPTEPPPASGGPGDSGAGPRISFDQARDLARMRRTVNGSPEGRHIAGVAGGLARHLDVDPIIVRVGLVVLIFFGGAGLLLYAVGWLCVPEEGRDQAIVKIDPRSRVLVLYVGAGLALLAILGDTVGRFHLPWPLLIVALILLALLTRNDSSRRRWRDQPVGATTPGPEAPTMTSYAVTGPGGTTGIADPTAPGGPAPTAPPVAWGHPPDPRRRGPLLFWPTLFLIALAESILVVLDTAGAHVAGPAYPALALGIVGTMLLVGAFWGRAGGLVALGLVGTLTLAVTTVAHEWDVHGTDLRLRATSAAQVRDSYHVSVGEVELDLSAVRDPEALDGRTLHLDGHVGRILVVVPDRLDVTAYGRVTGPGRVELFDEDRGGVGTALEDDRPGATAAAPHLTVQARLNVGSVEVIDENEAARTGRLVERSSR